MSRLIYKTCTRLAKYYREDPRRWIKGTPHDENGGICLMAGLIKFSGNAVLHNEDDVFGAISRNIKPGEFTAFPWGDREKAFTAIIPWNDSEKTSLHDVLDVLDRTAAEAKTNIKPNIFERITAWWRGNDETQGPKEKTPSSKP